MQKIVDKKLDLGYIYDLAWQAKESGDIDQAIILSEKGLKEAESQLDDTWRPKFEMLAKEMQLNYSSSKLDIDSSEATGIVKSNSNITKINGVGPSIAQKLYDVGITTIKQLSTCNPKILSHINGIGLETAKKFIRLAREYLGISENNTDEKKNPINKQQVLLEDYKSGNIEYDINSYENKIEEFQRLKSHTDPWFDKKFNVQRGTRSFPRIQKPKCSQVDLINTKSQIVKSIDDSNIHYNEEAKKAIQEENLEGEYLPEMEEKQNIKQIKKKIKEIAEKYRPQSPILLNIKPKQNKEKAIPVTSTIIEPKKGDIILKLKNMISNTAQINAFEMIPHNTKEFETILRNIDIILFKIISSDNGKHILLIFPIKINSIRDVLVVSEEKIKYLTNLEKNLLLNTYIANFKSISNTILEDILEKREIHCFFQNYLKHDIIMDKSISNEISLYSSPIQFQVYINPILVSEENIQFVEKALSFAYQRCSGFHFIHISQLEKLLCFLEKKFWAIEEYIEEEPNDQKLEHFREKIRRKILIYSFPFIGFGFLLVTLGLTKLDFFLQSFIKLSYGIIGIYIGLIGFFWYKYHIKNQEIKAQLLTPFHQKSVKLDNSSLEFIYQELSDKEMLQFGYECFGKDSKHKLLNTIEEQHAKYYSMEQVDDIYSEFFEQEDNFKYSSNFRDFLND